MFFSLKACIFTAYFLSFNNQLKTFIMINRLFITTLAIITLMACNTKTEITKVDALGKVNSVLVVIDNDKWQEQLGDSIRSVLAENLVGFPQEEPRFNLTQVAKKNFKRAIALHRNVVVFTIGNKNNFTISKDKYARPQRIVSITATDENGLFQALKDHKKEIIDTFKKSDLKTIQQLTLKRLWPKDSIKTFKNLGVSVKIPILYLKVHDTSNYIWFRKDIPEGYLNLQVYAVPINSEAEFNDDNIIKWRNEKGEKYIPGDKEDSYVTTEDAFAPIQFNTTMLGRKTIETHGVWELKNGFMAGPFLSYALLDKAKNRVIVAEGFVYAPNIKKRDYLFEIEALLRTLEIDE